jgi:hypothetical protein
MCVRLSHSFSLFQDLKLIRQLNMDLSLQTRKECQSPLPASSLFFFSLFLPFFLLIPLASSSLLSSVGTRQASDIQETSRGVRILKDSRTALLSPSSLPAFH